MNFPDYFRSETNYDRNSTAHIHITPSARQLGIKIIIKYKSKELVLEKEHYISETFLKKLEKSIDQNEYLESNF